MYVSLVQIRFLKLSGKNYAYRRSPDVTPRGKLITEELEVTYMNGMTLSQYHGSHKLMMASLSQVIEIDTNGPTF